MRRFSFTLAAAALVLGVLTGCGIPDAPPAVPDVNGSSTETPPPAVPSSDFASSTSGYWSGYWTWANGKWVWTWVWYPTGDNWVVS